MKLPLQIKIVIGIVAILICWSGISSLYTGSTEFYNSVKSYEFENNRLEELQLTTFDNNYLAFSDKFNITDLNKETFIEVTKIIFSARADGENVAWKWVHENQQIDYNQFTKFYADLSSFTEGRYAENNAIEKQKQENVKRQNLLISTFPGVIYNHFMKIKPLKYNKGFLTKETKDLFNQ